MKRPSKDARAGKPSRAPSQTLSVRSTTTPTRSFLARKDHRGFALRVHAAFVNLIAHTGVPVRGALARAPFAVPVPLRRRRERPEGRMTTMTWFVLPLHDNDGRPFEVALLAQVLFTLWQFNPGFSLHEQVGYWAKSTRSPAYVDVSFAIELATRSPLALRDILARFAALLGQECIALRTLRHVEFELIAASPIALASEEG